MLEYTIKSVLEKTLSSLGNGLGSTILLITVDVLTASLSRQPFSDSRVSSARPSHVIAESYNPFSHFVSVRLGSHICISCAFATTPGGRKDNAVVMIAICFELATVSKSSLVNYSRPFPYLSQGGPLLWPVS